jgi:hypothetical protein
MKDNLGDIVSKPSEPIHLVSADPAKEKQKYKKRDNQTKEGSGNLFAYSALFLIGTGLFLMGYKDHCSGTKACGELVAGVSALAIIGDEYYRRKSQKNTQDEPEEFHNE